jgi:hypothetical protein
VIDNKLEPGSSEGVGTAAPPVQFDEYKFQRFMKQVKESQSLPLALIAGFGAAVVGAALWAAITIITDYQIGWMAVGVGFLVGFAVRYLGKGVDKVFGFIGAGFALFGCLLGNFLAAAVIISQLEAVSVVDVLIFLVTTPVAAVELMSLTFSPIDLLFYGIAIYQGYKLAFRRVSEAELASAMSAPV